MRRHLAILITLSLFSLQVQSQVFHVHAMSGQAEDRDHQHGPAIHHHDDFNSARHVDEGDRETRGAVITIAVPVATVSTAVIVCAELPEAIAGVELLLAGEMRAIEVRSHGPPPAHNSFLRGPPTLIQS